MKCSNRVCSRSIGLVAHRRWFSNRCYTAQGIVAMRSWVICQNGRTKSTGLQPTSSGSSCRLGIPRSVSAGGHPIRAKGNKK